MAKTTAGRSKRPLEAGTNFLTLLGSQDLKEDGKTVDRHGRTLGKNADDRGRISCEVDRVRISIMARALSSQKAGYILANRTCYLQKQVATMGWVIHFFHGRLSRPLGESRSQGLLAQHSLELPDALL